MQEGYIQNVQLQDIFVLSRYISYTFDPELILTSNHANTALTALARADYGGRWVMWEHLKANWREDPVPDG